MCESNRITSEGFSRSFLTLRAFYFIGDLVCLRMGWHFQMNHCWGLSASGFILKFVNKFGSDFVWGLIFLCLIPFCRIANMNRPLPVGGIPSLLSWLSILFCRSADFSGMFFWGFVGFWWFEEYWVCMKNTSWVDYLYFCYGGRWDWFSGFMSDFRVIRLYLLSVWNHQESTRQYLAPSRGAVRCTRN